MMATASVGSSQPDAEDTFKSLVCVNRDHKKEITTLIEFMTCTPIPHLQGVVDVLCEACDTMKWATPTPIQKEALPVAFQGVCLNLDLLCIIWCVCVCERERVSEASLCTLCMLDMSTECG